MQRRSTVRSAHSLQRSGGGEGRRGERERKGVYKDSTREREREEDITEGDLAHCVRASHLCACVRACVSERAAPMKIDKMKEKQVVSSPVCLSRHGNAPRRASRTPVY